MKNWNYISIVISTFAIVLSIIAICNVYPRELGIDYLGLIVGVLALITTILLGWQIYILFDIKSIKEDVSKRDDYIYIRSEKNFAEMHMGMLLHYCNKELKSSNDSFFLAHHGTSAIIHLSRIGDVPKCVDVISLILLHSEDLKSMKISQTQKDALNELLLSIEHPKQIHQLVELASVFYQIECS
jgi:hypothetical protein